jgi:REP element-mobilizing transposase RayT
MSKPFDPDRFHRRSVRLKDYDYRSEGAYFITLCTHQRECLFGTIVDDKLHLSDLGQIIFDCWLTLPTHHSVELDEFIVMPNHLHAIIVLTTANSVGAGRASPSLTSLPLPNNAPIPQNAPSGSLGTIIGSFKSAATKQINIRRNTPGSPLWQRSFYDQIIRDEIALNRIRQYIIDNPANWNTDSENLSRPPH